jgi:hypothetical protein
MPDEYTYENTFGATDVLGLANDDFEFQGNDVAGSKDSAIPKDAGGEFLPAAHKTFNEKEEFTANYVAKKVGAVVPPAVVLGLDANGYHVTGAKLGSTNTGHVTLAVSAHKHLGAMTGTAHKENPHTIVWPANIEGYGSFDPFGTSGVPAVQIQSSSYDVSIEHVDAQDRKGDFLVGRSQGVKVEASLEAVTDVETVADPSGWKITGKDKKRGNEGFYGLSLRGEMYPGTAWAGEPE